MLIAIIASYLTIGIFTALAVQLIIPAEYWTHTVLDVLLWDVLLWPVIWFFFIKMRWF